jgi:hypothetical protein
MSFFSNLSVPEGSNLVLSIQRGLSAVRIGFRCIAGWPAEKK